MSAVHWFLVAATALFVVYLVLVALVLAFIKVAARMPPQADLDDELALLIALTGDLDGRARTEMVDRIEERQRAAGHLWADLEAELDDLTEVWRELEE